MTQKRFDIRRSLWRMALSFGAIEVMTILSWVICFACWMASTSSTEVGGMISTLAKYSLGFSVFDTICAVMVAIMFADYFNGKFSNYELTKIELKGGSFFVLQHESDYYLIDGRKGPIIRLLMYPFFKKVREYHNFTQDLEIKALGSAELSDNRIEVKLVGSLRFSTFEELRLGALDPIWSRQLVESLSKMFPESVELIQELKVVAATIAEEIFSEDRFPVKVAAGVIGYSRKHGDFESKVSPVRLEDVSVTSIEFTKVEKMPKMRLRNDNLN